MNKYAHQKRLLAAVDCIVFGFDGQHIKLLLIKRGFDPERNKWSLMGGFVQEKESLEDAASRVLTTLTGLGGIYLEQLHTFGHPDRDPIERTISVAYFALVDIHEYENQLNHEYHAEWFNINEIPDLIFDHERMVKMARERLKTKAGHHPILFELLPAKFTLSQIHTLYEEIFNTKLDKRNFIRKIISTELLVKQKEKDMTNSKRGAYYFKINSPRYKQNVASFLNIIPNSHKLL